MGGFIRIFSLIAPLDSGCVQIIRHFSGQKSAILSAKGAAPALAPLLQGGH